MLNYHLFYTHDFKRHEMFWKYKPINKCLIRHFSQQLEWGGLSQPEPVWAAHSQFMEVPSARVPEWLSAKCVHGRTHTKLLEIEQDQKTSAAYWNHTYTKLKPYTNNTNLREINMLQQQVRAQEWNRYLSI